MQGGQDQYGTENMEQYMNDPKKSTRAAGKMEINKAVAEAKECIIQGQVEAASQHVYKKMND
jgi:hypothetical protein